jgi:hypothetical protein
MTDLFSTPQAPTPQEEDGVGKPPVLRRVPNSTAYALITECFRCGAVPASFGEGVSLKKGKPGTWFCGRCYKLRVKEKAEPGAGP